MYRCAERRALLVQTVGALGTGDTSEAAALLADVGKSIQSDVRDAARKAIAAAKARLSGAFNR